MISTRAVRLLDYLLRINHAPLVFIVLSFVSPSLAQTNGPTSAVRIKVTMVIVPELEACKPKGYAPTGHTSKCKLLTPDDIYSWIEDGRPNSEQEIRSTQLAGGLAEILSLNSAQTELLADYSSKFRRTPSQDPGERFSVVLLFDFGRSISGDIIVRRKPSPSGDDSFYGQNRVYERTVARRTRFIYHERADNFLPARRMLWTLKAARTGAWRFRTGRKR